ncbi:MAG: hypothetical protein FJ297_07165 [Planctomycetes bacterium]|nr:hypothetical protein [Planctomycetota bacterium]
MPRETRNKARRRDAARLAAERTAPRISRRAWVPVFLLAVSLAAAPAAARDPLSFDDLDTLLDSDPHLPIPANLKAFDPALGVVWTRALSAPESDLRRMAAETIGFARQLGMPGLEGAIDDLTRIAEDAKEQPRTRLAAIKTLVTLDVRTHAERLERCAGALGHDGVQIVYPALARWGYGPSRDAWLRTLTDPRSLGGDRLLAVISLGEVREIRADAALRGIVADSRARVDLRMASARALARIRPNGLLAFAAPFAARTGGDGRFERAMGAAMARELEGEEIGRFLEGLAVDDEPAVADLALARLIEIDVQRVARLAPRLLANRDANCRRWATLAVGALPSAEHCRTLGPVLNDPHPGIRVRARELLLVFATQHQLEDTVIEVALPVLHGDDWRGIEQASRIMGVLDHKPAAARLVEILDRPRIEEKVSAAWALRKLAVLETLEPVFAYAERVSNFTVGRQNDPAHIDYNPVLTHVFQLFGILDFRKSEPLLRRYIPKDLNIAEARSGAIWAMGRFHKGDPEPTLVASLEQRLSDTNSNPPESNRVRQICAVSLGRMNAVSSLPALRRYMERDTVNSPCGYACGWAVEQLTGEKVPKPEPLFEYRQGFFLAPVQKEP